MDYALSRKRMVEEQLMRRGISDRKVLELFGRVERHKFVPEGLRSSAYGDFPLAIGEGQTISQPYIVALMTESLRLRETDKVLEIGTGSGYQTVFLAELAKDVYTVEKYDSLSGRAKEIFDGLGYKNIKVRVGDGTDGWREFAPYDKIIVTAAATEVPKPLIEQLKAGGRLLIPIGERYSQVLTAVDKEKEGAREEKICGCVFVPLQGSYSCE
ncbi:MAG: protein-L-isoaspartate(D-aspartate) O-methyltransferase [Candidatus Omnitrophica bacterium]|nr:protein-L-isoaspartate(D-aspartate) O-methyltransferase [Candidatus Omnitrophota bacterium]